MWQKAAEDDLLSCHVPNCSSWIGHHWRSVSTQLIDELYVPPCLKNCTGTEQKRPRWAFMRMMDAPPSLTVTHSALGLLLFIRPQRASVAASFRSKFLEFSNLTISGMAPATDELTFHVCDCASVLQWFRMIVLHLPRSLKQSVQARLGLMTCTASQMTVFTSSPCAPDRTSTRIFSTLCFLSFSMSAPHKTDSRRRNYT